MHLSKLFRLTTIFIAITSPASNAFASNAAGNVFTLGNAHAQDTCREFERRSDFTMRYWHAIATVEEKHAFCRCELNDLKKIVPNATVSSCVTFLEAMVGESVQDMHPRAALVLALALLYGPRQN